jgi:hypothetical protein
MTVSPSPSLSFDGFASPQQRSNWSTSTFKLVCLLQVINATRDIFCLNSAFSFSNELLAARSRQVCMK